MAEYSIKDLELLSGIKAHTLRIWEQRYNILNPQRSPTNIRYYTHEDLRRLLNIAILNNNGYKISEISRFSTDEISKKVIEITGSNIEVCHQLDSLIISMVELDELRFEKVISSNILKMGFEKTMVNIVFPFMKRAGIMWQTGAINPAHKHFISHLIRQKMIAALDAQVHCRDSEAKKFLFFMPEGELNELILLFCSYITKTRNHISIYLGPSVPFEDLVKVYHISRPDYLVSVLTSLLPKSSASIYFRQIAEKLPLSTVLLSGIHSMEYPSPLPKNIQILKEPTDLIRFC